MYYTHEFIDGVRKIVCSQPIPPVYNPDEWSKNPRDFNCYAYALQINMNLFGIEFRPGFTTGNLINRKDYTAGFILKNVLIDCENLGLNISETTIDEKIKCNEYKIVVYFINRFSFHFIRQDSNGKWSHKNGWLEPIKIVNEEDILKEDNLLKVIGIFKISKKEE